MQTSRRLPLLPFIGRATSGPYNVTAGCVVDVERGPRRMEFLFSETSEMISSSLKSVGMRRVGGLVGMFGLVVFCLGVTQIGPCPGTGNGTACIATADCDDSNGCTSDTCNTTTGACSHTAQCNDDHCINDLCVACIADAGCNDNNGCTTDTCDLTTYTCTNDSACLLGEICINDECVLGDLCVTDADCDDGDDCTTDTCEDSGLCGSETIPGCTAELAVFVDPVSGFETVDVRDVNDEIINFDKVTMAVVDKNTGSEFEAGLWDVNGNFLNASQTFAVAFGTVNGEYRAYFIEVASQTICDFHGLPNSFSYTGTLQTVPHN